MIKKYEDKLEHKQKKRRIIKFIKKIINFGNYFSFIFFQF